MSSLYLSMAGLETASAKLDTVAQNLANVNSTGYAAAQLDAMGLPFAGDAPPVGADVIPLGENVDTSIGPVQRTGSSFDVAPQNGGWLVVQTAPGQQALTRAGALAINAAGILTTQTGHPVIGVGGQPVSLPALQKLTIGQDGTISGVPAGAATQDPKVFGQLLLAAAPTNGKLTPIGDSLYALPTGTQPAQNASATVEQGYLDGSNVNPTQAMVSMVEATKSFQLQTQFVQVAAKTSTALDQIIMQG
jgi:flagellar basal-body rod protein FlgF